MTEVERIADQIRRAFEGDAWHGPSLMELLPAVNSMVANAHPVNNAHSIWEIVNHLTAWKGAVLQRMNGHAIELIGEQDWPTVRNSTEEAWQMTLRDLQAAQKKLYDAVLSLPESRLNEQVPNRDHNMRYMLLGVAQHELYHAGQIAVLRKAAVS
ncbi:MAG TPA: DinB family protein [Terriglobales bacterium]|nr:DinB family protein [Terriglobales bacterium]